jgi:hypothetical protein
MRNLLTGISVGVTQTLIGHPFDTIKTRLQNNLSFKSTNISFYYKGGLSQFSYAATKNSIIFPSFYYAKNHTDSNILAGVFAGICAFPAQYFFDTIKIKKQTNEKLTIKSFFDNKGKISTAMKESVGMAFYFSSYHYFKDYDLHPVISGGLSGIFCWLGSYPLDVIKSRQISKNISFNEAVKMGKFYKGIVPCLMRACLVNSAVWTVVEKIKSYDLN